jgi:hypothetical protein
MATDCDMYKQCFDYFMVPFMFDEFELEYEDAQVRHPEDPSEYITAFQIKLREVKDWSESVASGKHRAFIEYAKANEDNPYTEEEMDSLRDSLFVAYGKELTKSNLADFNLDIPKWPVFLHECFISSARTFYNRPLLFFTGNDRNPMDEDRRYEEIDSVLRESTARGIRKFLPIKEILRMSRYKNEEGLTLGENEEDKAEDNENNIEQENPEEGEEFIEEDGEDDQIPEDGEYSEGDGQDQEDEEGEENAGEADLPPPQPPKIKSVNRGLSHQRPRTQSQPKQSAVPRSVVSRAFPKRQAVSGPA